jgi:uncharacterized Ntn-hydrolase superfamily protein
MKWFLLPCTLLAAVLLLVEIPVGEIGMVRGEPTVATFSIAGNDPETGDLGVAVQSKFFGVGSVVPWAKAGVGAIATQAFANTRYGPEGLALLERGLSPEEVVKKLTETDAGAGKDFRQVGIVDAKGRSAAFTGEKAQDWKGHITGANFACQGNILAGEEVVKRMSYAFRFAEGPLPERLVAALKGAQTAGGDKRGRQSAALLVVRKDGGYAGWNDRYIDIRVEDNEKPIEELERLLKMHRQFYRDIPVPGKEKGESAPEGEGSPKAVFVAMVKGLMEGKFEEVYELYCKDYRGRVTLEAFVASNRHAHERLKRELEVITYVKALVDGDNAEVYYRHVGSNRPNPGTVKMVKENGKWRIK